MQHRLLSNSILSTEYQQTQEESPSPLLLRAGAILCQFSTVVFFSLLLLSLPALLRSFGYLSGASVKSPSGLQALFPSETEVAATGMPCQSLRKVELLSGGGSEFSPAITLPSTQIQFVYSY